jgi:hypothetical protein
MADRDDLGKDKISSVALLCDQEGMLHTFPSLGITNTKIHFVRMSLREFVLCKPTEFS